MRIFWWKKRRFRLRRDSSPGLLIAGRCIGSDKNFKHLINLKLFEVLWTESPKIFQWFLSNNRKSFIKCKIKSTKYQNLSRVKKSSNSFVEVFYELSNLLWKILYRFNNTLRKSLWLGSNDSRLGMRISQWKTQWL